MRRLHVAAAAALSALALVALPCALRAQGQVRIELPREVPFPGAPEITVRATGFPDATPRRIRLRLALDFGIGLVVYDSTMAGDQAVFRMIKLLPENRDVYAEARVIDAAGQELQTLSQFAGRTGPRLQIVSPVGTTGVTFTTRRPTFEWRSAKVSAPPGPWLYELLLTETASQTTTSVNNITDTTFTYPTELDANTSYKWKVVARLANGLEVDNAVASGLSTFTIRPSDAVVKTLLYQNFPNPFPTAASSTTCIWFDLKVGGRVELTIHDLRGHRVRTMIPGQLSGTLGAGRYGRENEFDAGGCDPRLRWDGLADDGRTVPAGLYLLRFKTDGESETVKRMLFLGR